MNEKRTRRYAMKHEADNGGDAYDVGKKMTNACGLFMILMPIALFISLLYVSCTRE